MSDDLISGIIFVVGGLLSILFYKWIAKIASSVIAYSQEAQEFIVIISSIGLIIVGLFEIYYTLF